MTDDQRESLISLATEMAVGRNRPNAATAIRAALNEIDRLKSRIVELESLFGSAGATIAANPGSTPAVMMPPYVRPEFHIDPDEA